MRIQTRRRVNNETSFLKQQGTLSKKISVRDAGVFGKSVNPIRNRGGRLPAILLLRSFFGRIYGAPICFRFYLNFNKQESKLQ